MHTHESTNIRISQILNFPILARPYLLSVEYTKTLWYSNRSN